MVAPPPEVVTVNEVLQDRGIRHAVYLERLKAGEAARIVRFLGSELYPELLTQVERRLAGIRRRGGRDTGPYRTKRYQAMVREVDDLVAEGYREARALSVKNLANLAVVESQFQARLMARAFPIDIDVAEPPGRLLRSIVTSRPMQGRFLRDWYKGLERTAQQAVRRQVNLGLGLGESNATITRRLRGIVPTQARHAETVTRTAVTHVAEHARQDTWAENQDIVKGYRFVATLDARTTDICASLDGRVFNVGEGPRPPMHMRCRSTTVAILKSLEELGFSDRRVNQIPEGRRAAIAGDVPASETYGDWLRRQPRAVQADVLGKGRAEVFQRGAVKIERFVDSTYKPLSLEKLLRLEADIIARN